MNKNKLEIAAFLKELNRQVDTVNAYRLKEREIKVEKLDCKKLAERIGVTPATISNATLDSKFSLLFDIAEEIHFCYENYFMYKTDKEYKENEENEPTLIYNRFWVLSRITNKY